MEPTEVFGVSRLQPILENLTKLRATLNKEVNSPSCQQALSEVLPIKNEPIGSLPPGYAEEVAEYQRRFQEHLARVCMYHGIPPRIFLGESPVTPVNWEVDGGVEECHEKEMLVTMPFPEKTNFERAWEDFHEGIDQPFTVQAKEPT